MQAFDPSIAAVVFEVAIFDAVDEMGVVGIHALDERHGFVGALHECRILREHHDVFVGIAHEHRMQQRHTVARATVEQLFAVEFNDVRHQRHACRCAQIFNIALVIGGFHHMVVGFAGFKIACDGREFHGRFTKCLEVKGLERFGNLMEHKIATEGIARSHKILHRKIARVVAIFRVQKAGAPELAGNVVIAIQRTRTRANNMLAPKVLVHEEVEHARGELSAHCAALQNEVYVNSLGAFVSRGPIGGIVDV